MERKIQWRPGRDRSSRSIRTLGGWCVGRAGADIVCANRDQGIAIPEADREWHFKAFYRGHNIGDRPGTGLESGHCKAMRRFARGRNQSGEQIG